MQSIFFKLSPVQARDLQTHMEEEGYTSKAEFFRFLLKFYKYNKDAHDLKIEQLTSELEKTLIRLDQEGKLDKPLRDQLSDV